MGVLLPIFWKMSTLRLLLRVNDLKGRAYLRPKTSATSVDSSRLTLHFDKLSVLSLPKEAGLGEAEWVKSLVR